MPEKFSLEAFRKARPQDKISETMIVHYGSKTLHVEPETVVYDAPTNSFSLLLRVTQEIKPERKARKQKDEQTQAAQAKASGKK
jgi:hypothetical protein